MIDGWTLTALIVAAVGVAVLIAGRWRDGFGEWARALLISALAIAISGVAWRGQGPNIGGYATWFSGFFICAALHRWIDAASQLSRIKGADQ